MDVRKFHCKVITSKYYMLDSIVGNNPIKRLFNFTRHFIQL